MTSDRYRETVVTEDVDGICYTSSKFPTTAALRFMARAVAVLGEYGLQALVARFAKGDRGSTLVQGLGPRALVQIAAGLEADSSLPRELTEGLKASRLRPVGEGTIGNAFDRHFQGEYFHLAHVIVFVLTHNFLGFTLGSQSLGGSRTSEPTPGDDQSSSPTPSEG